MRREHTLIVEDDQDMCDVLRLALESQGYLVEVARNGREAIAAVSKGMPGLILLDMMMPVMNGWEFARELARRYPDHAPIVLMTAAEYPRLRALEVGATDVLAKPFPLGALFEVVRRHIGQPEPRTEASPS